MKKMSSLGRREQQLVEQNLHLIPPIIYRRFIINEAIVGFAYEDLFQEGCICLCKAAMNFEESQNVPFPVYAQKVIINGLLTYRHMIFLRQKKISCIPFEWNWTDFTEDSPISHLQIMSEDAADKQLIETDIFDMLYLLKEQYTGITRLGIEALTWKLKGYSGVEIAKMYGVKPNAVGAWISRAKQKLKHNRVFIGWMESYEEKTVS